MNMRSKASPFSRERGLKSVAAPQSRATLSPIPPGEVLTEEFLRPLGISQNALARALGVPPARINDIVHNRRAISVDTAVRLSIFFGTSIDFWINLQAQYDTRVARRDIEPKLAKRIQPFKAA